MWFSSCNDTTSTSAFTIQTVERIKTAVFSSPGMWTELLVLVTIFSFVKLGGWVVPCQARPIGADTRDSLRHARRERHSRLAAKALVSGRSEEELATSSHTLVTTVSKSNGSAPLTTSQFAKRSSNGKATFYAVSTASIKGVPQDRIKQSCFPLRYRLTKERVADR
jgi:hypothetical protein